MGIKTIVLDFDGVLAESVGVKDGAFKKLFSSFPGQLEEILDYHLSNNAVIRFDKFEHIYNNILKEEYTDEIKKSLCDQYSSIVVEEISSCPEVPGSLEFLEYYHGNNIPIYVASVNPLNELKQIIENRDLSRFVKDIYAHPWMKKDSLKDISEKEGVSLDSMIFVGDSPEDYQAAKDAVVPFIGRISNKTFPDVDIPIFNDFFEIKNYILGDN